MSYLIGAVLIVGGLVLGGFALHGMRTRPGWDSPYGVGALLLVLGGFLVLGGVLNIVLGLRN